MPEKYKQVKSLKYQVWSRKAARNDAGEMGRGKATEYRKYHPIELRIDEVPHRV